MLGISIVFDYPIKRPYPWRFTTLLIFSISAVVLSGLIYINVAIVGLTPTSFPSTTFEMTPDLSWFDRVNLKKAMSTCSCEPVTLVSGQRYRTQNGVFPYTIREISSREPGGRLSSLAYEGQVIEECEDIIMSANGGISTGDEKFTATTICTFSGGANFTIDFSTSEDDLLEFESQTRMARKAGQLVSVLEREVVFFLSIAFTLPDAKFHPCGFYIALDPAPSYPNGPNCTHFHHMPNEVEQVLHLVSTYLQVLRSTIYLDLGIKSPYYLFSNPELMRKTLQPNFKDLGLFSPSDFKDAYDVLHNMTRYGLPFEEPQPVQFHAQYTCRGMTWKSPSNLVLDVLVATVSLFMAYWGILNFVLQYFATSSSPRGNHCTCPNCNELPHHVASSPEVHELRPLDSGTEYRPVPTRSQSTPVSVPV
ncbi:hypothetical protein BDV93DRAFT_610910 [Ceratobasidium sp. AG-I]|nr:hypothetical protein BDV93DRAFT_610910 [Ceratobasidium sp. AG-I]